jgi:hypothetical protein
MVTRRQSPATAPPAAGTGCSDDAAGAGGVDDSDEQEPSTVTPSAPAPAVNSSRRRESDGFPMTTD